MEHMFNFTAYGNLGRCCRYSFYSTNFLSAITCLSAIGYGSWVIAKKKNYSALFEPTLYVSVAFILVIIGIFAICVAAVGCYATSRELRCLMYSFAVANAVLFLMLMIGGVMGFVFQQQLKQKALDLQMMAALKQFYGQPSSADITLALDLVQENYQCCGISFDKEKNFFIWRTSKWHMDYKGETKVQVPLSCCVVNPESGNYVNATSCQTTDLQNPNRSVIYVKGCYEDFYYDLMYVSRNEAALGIAASIVLLIPAFFAIFMAKLIQK